MIAFAITYAVATVILSVLVIITVRACEWFLDYWCDSRD